MHEVKMFISQLSSKHPFGSLLSKSSRCFSICLLTSAALALSVHADQYSDYGVQLYNSGKYNDARKYFDQSLKLSPRSDNAHYYKASCYEHCNDLSGAQIDYQFVVSNSSNSKLVALAKAALDRVNAQINSQKNDDVGVNKSVATATASSAVAGAAQNKKNATVTTTTVSTASYGGSGSTSDVTKAAIVAALAEHYRVKTDPTDVLPDETRVYFTQSGHDDIYIDSQINGRDYKVILDTGAFGTMIGKNQLEQLGVRIPTNAEKTSVGGIGGTRLSAWIVPLQIKVGGMKRTLQVSVPETWEGPPLLGQDFYADLEYEIDNKGHCLYFRKSKPLSASEKTMYCIPFTRHGRHLAVELEGDAGRKTKMLVDTGAEGIGMTMANIKALGIDIPADAQRTRSSGVGGTADGLGFVVDSLRLGPIIKRNVRVDVTTSEDGMLGTKHGQYGLLGQGFFGDWRFTVDNANSYLRFFH